MIPNAGRGIAVKKRIWELDALRGICILGMLAVHLIFDLVDIFSIGNGQYPRVILFLFDWGGLLFVLLSGICVTLGSRTVRRGIIVLLCGLICTLVTWCLAKFNILSEWIIIWFGVLHCLGICMLLWPLFRRLPLPVLTLLSIGFIAFGFWLKGQTANFPWLVGLGLTFPGFSSGDYFPLFPNLGYFLLGAVLGKMLYPTKTTLFKKVNSQTPVLRFLQICGRQSLLIYLLHQPVLYALLFLISLF